MEAHTAVGWWASGEAHRLHRRAGVGAVPPRVRLQPAWLSGIEVIPYAVSGSGSALALSRNPAWLCGIGFRGVGYQGVATPSQSRMVEPDLG